MGRLVDFEDPGRFHDRGLLLPGGKALRPFPVDVDPRELFTIFIEDSNLPVTMLPPAIPAE
jgi:hypothetical protein